MKKIAVLGLGSIGRRHHKNITSLGCSTYVYDPAYKGDGPKRNWIIDWADAVVISSPTSIHWEDINDCRRAEKPCFVEKPIGHMNAEIITSHVKMVGYNLRFHSCVKKARQWLADGKIGQPLWAHFTCSQFNDKPAYRRDGVILNWSHEIDLALHLLGSAKTLNARSTNNESIADIWLNQSGCDTTIHLDYVTTPEIRSFSIAGTKGTIIVDLVRRGAACHMPTGVTTVYAGSDSFDENYLDEMRAFLMRLDGQPTLGCTAQEGLDVLDICLKAKEMAR